MTKKNVSEVVKPKTFAIRESVWEEAKKKAAYVPMSIILRKLIQLWLSGELDDLLTKEDQTND